jgi:5-methylcytosine-specific restriction endonuclease McrA
MIISIHDARLAGLPRYMTGKPCKHGHVAERLTRTSHCVVCLSEQGAKYYWANPKASSDRCRRRRAEKATEVGMRKREYYLANQQAIRTRSSEWKTKNPIDACAHSHARRARKLAAPGTYTRQDVVALLTLQKHACVGCGVRLKSKYHVDHIVPLVKGGTNDRKNIQILCAPCNLSKGSKHPTEWALQNGRLI